ncbi:hypothetical protein [Paenibacillus sp. FSL H3-0286]|uniref:hypothetical protein n=1 Tax=Paenibacillus sp. FSL H3-0286 TaxID=2921427 RepID=UPI003252082E
MTQIQLTDQQLNRALAELMGYTVKELPIGSNGRQLYALVTPIGRQRMAALTIDNAFFDAPDYCTDPAASLEVQAKAIEVDSVGYVRNLEIAKWKKIMAPLARKEVSVLLNASPRERAEAAYITLSISKEDLNGTVGYR